jgi:hypothetical protein
MWHEEFKQQYSHFGDDENNSFNTDAEIDEQKLDALVELHEVTNVSHDHTANTS